MPSDSPTNNPSSEPSVNPTNNPTESIKPSATPTESPSSLNSEPSNAPSKSPTLSPSKRPTTSPSKSPTANPTAFSSCTNNPDYIFELDNLNLQNCAWFTKQATKIEFRTERYCPKEEIAYNCQLACGACTIDTPSASPTFGPCEDSAVFIFQLNNGNDRGCDWLTKNTLNAATRISTYCNKDYDGTLVREACPLSCGDCTAELGRNIFQ